MDADSIYSLCEIETENLPVLSLQSAFDSVGGKLGHFNEREIILFLRAKIDVNLDRYFSQVENTLDSESVRELSIMIYEDYKAFKITEIDFIFRQAAKGKYGKVYNRIDILTAFSWFKEYANDFRKYYNQRINQFVKHDTSKCITAPIEFVKVFEENKRNKETSSLRESIQKLKDKIGTKKKPNV